MSSQQASAIKQQTELVNANITPDHNTPTSNHQQNMMFSYNNIQQSHPNCVKDQHKNNNNQQNHRPSKNEIITKYNNLARALWRKATKKHKS